MSHKRLPRSSLQNRLHTYPRANSRSPLRETPCKTRHYDDRVPRVLDVMGSSREISLSGHVSLVSRLPIRKLEHRHLVDKYIQHPGTYEAGMVAWIQDEGNFYVTLRMCDDVTRSEVGEFLLSRGWKMIGYSTMKEGDKSYILEKWCNIRDH